MNIAFAKIGKSIKFNSAFSPIGGDNEAPAFLKALANNNPNIKFYIVGRSDFKTLVNSQKNEMFPYGNVINCWADIKSSTDEENWQLINKWHERVKFDYGVIMFGQVGAVTIPNRIEQVRDRSLTASVIDMTKNYSTPLTVWLNDSKVPYIEIQNDPRYHSNQSRDLFHLPISTLSQYDYEYDANHIESYEKQDRITTKIKARYAGMELGYCFGKNYPDIKSYNKNKKFMVVLNEGKPSRYNMLNEWVLKYLNKVEIYGKWEDERVTNDPRFVGSLDIDKLSNLLKSVKYTFIVPIAPGWVTSKYIEMIHNGVIPFFHPSYDTQMHIGVPKELRPKTPSELFKTVVSLEENQTYYNDLMSELQKVLKPSYYDGSFLSETIMREINPNYVKPNLVVFDKNKVNNFEEFFND